MKSRKKTHKPPTKALVVPPAKSINLPGAPSGVRFTETALIVEKTFTHSEWSNLGKTLVLANKASKWWMGDWMVKGPNAAKFKASINRTEADRKGHRRIKRGFCVKMADLLGLSPGHISNVASVCNRVPPELRDGLTPGHAVEILQNVPDTEFPKWRDRVIREGLSCKQLRVLLRQSLRTGKPSPGTRRPPLAAAEFLQCVRTFNADQDKWTEEQWAYYEVIFEPIIRAFKERSHLNDSPSSKAGSDRASLR